MKFKIGDIIAIIYFAAFVCLVFFFPLDYGPHGSADLSKLEITGKVGLFWSGFSTDGIKAFGRVVGHFPYISGFLKVGLLATLGEMIKVRGKTGSWKTPDLLLKFLVWGVYGMLFTIAFALFGKGIAAVMGTPVWPLTFEN